MPWLDLDCSKVFVGLDSFIGFDELPRRVWQKFEDSHPEADRFIAADEDERCRIRTSFAETAARKQAMAIAAPRPMPRQVRPDKIDDKLRTYIRGAHRVGVSLRELARRLDVSRATVTRALGPKKRRGRPPRVA